MTEVSENVRVCVRCRPMSCKEFEQNFKNVVEVIEDSNTVILKRSDDLNINALKCFTFDIVFGINSKQLDMYNKIARPILDKVFEGYNGTIFAYGQTGTGKTFTMEGIRSKPELRGIIPNSFAHIFGTIAKANPSTRFLVHVSYLEIYNEEVRDLLGKDQKMRLEVKERPDTGVYVKDLSTVMVHSPNEMEKLMSLGNKNRATASTNMNEHSSRSHAIYTITIERCEMTDCEKALLRQGKLHLVDLAGSERQSKSGVSGQRLQEANKINLSLTTLGNVISALVDGKSTHVPYRNSKLTRLLQDSLGGNSKTVMIANIGPTDYNFEESLSTLRYANRAKSIKNTAKINEDPKDALLRQFQKEIDELRRQLIEGGVDTLTVKSSVENANESIEVKKEQRRKNKITNLSNQQLLEMQQMIERDKRKLEEQKDLDFEERDKIKRRLSEKENELASAKVAQKALAIRMDALQKRIIVGGENLLEKAEAQEKLLEESAIELQNQENRAIELSQILKEKKEERINVEEKYYSLQDEAMCKKKKLQKLTTMYLHAKSDLEDLRGEHTREIEGLLENIKELKSELNFQGLIINRFIPEIYQDLIKRESIWNEEIGEWQLRYIAYTGNNMNKILLKNSIEQTDPFIAYLTYGVDTIDDTPTKFRRNQRMKLE